ncbi:MAG: J domain-containing protein [Acidimicrobiales bacterium]
MILAELEVFHSRPIAPTRRVALCRLNLPITPAPGFGGLLLGGVVAGHIEALDPDLFDDLHRLTLQLQEGTRVPQPRLRHRFQQDRIGLTRSTHRLVGEGEDLAFELESEKGAPAQHILAAVYAAGQLPLTARARVMDTIRKGMRWTGPLDHTFIAHLSGLDRSRDWSTAAFRDPVRWALGVLDLGQVEVVAVPGRDDIQRQFRELLRVAHPDHGGDADEAAQRIADLTEARRILLAS